MNRDRIPMKYRIFYGIIGLLMAGIFIYARPISGPMVPFGVYLITMIIVIGVIVTVC